jgi:hypothetical protein
LEKSVPKRAFWKKARQKPEPLSFIKDFIKRFLERAFWKKAQQKPDPLSFIKDFIKVFNNFYRFGFLARFFPKSALGSQNPRIYSRI